MTNLRILGKPLKSGVGNGQALLETLVGSGFTQVGWVLVSSQYQPQTFTLDPLYVDLLLDPTAIATLLTRPFLRSYRPGRCSMWPCGPYRQSHRPPCHSLSLSPRVNQFFHCPLLLILAQPQSLLFKGFTVDNKAA